MWHTFNIDSTYHWYRSWEFTWLSVPCEDNKPEVLSLSSGVCDTLLMLTLKLSFWYLDIGVQYMSRWMCVLIYELFVWQSTRKPSCQSTWYVTLGTWHKITMSLLFPGSLFHILKRWPCMTITKHLLFHILIWSTHLTLQSMKW